MRVFISQPMNGKKREEIVEIRKGIVEKLKARHAGEEVEIIDSIIAEKIPETRHDAVWYLGKALELLSTADLAYFGNGWENARGCRIENEVAVRYGIPREYYDDVPCWSKGE